MTQHTSTSHPHKRPKEHAVNLWKLAMILAFASGIIVTALFLFIAFVPEEQQRGPQANSMLKSNNKPLTISQKILRWLPKDHLPASSHPTTSSEENYGSLSNDTQIIYHSRFKTTDDYVPWLPFANQHSSRRFEGVNCPPVPDKTRYPAEYPLPDLLRNWNADDTTIPPYHYDSLCHFNYQDPNQLKQAYEYRKAELPFIAYNIPEVDKLSERWNNLEYLSKKLGSKEYRTETSHSNHFMYWTKPRGKFLRTREGKNWSEPTKSTTEGFENWLELAVKGQNQTLQERTHEYFRVSSTMGNPWMDSEFPFFSDRRKTLMMVEPKERRGIHCRFGMRNVIAEAHFDGGRNAVVQVLGLRRWILLHPRECNNLHMYPKGHPSGRHSQADWSQPDYEVFPNLKSAKGYEVILQPGDFLYVPMYWIHYIVSLNINTQCNARSGNDDENTKFIHECGF